MAGRRVARAGRLAGARPDRVASVPRWGLPGTTWLSIDASVALSFAEARLATTATLTIAGRLLYDLEVQ